jgi:hypothetical protein
MYSDSNYRDLERCHGVTWHDLVNLEPRLAELLWQARQAGIPCRRWSDVHRAFAPIRDRLTVLVGFAAKKHWHPVLGRTGAYEVAYWKLHGAVAALLPAGSAGTAEAAEAPAKQRADKVAEAWPATKAATMTAGV